MIVHLTWQEVALAVQVGTRRNMCALNDQRVPAHGLNPDDPGWSDNIEGACGEMAAAKAIGVYWTPTVNTFRTGGDVGDWQVRTRLRPHYELLIRDNDDDDAVFILVRGRAPTYDVVGWIRGADAKRADWRHAYGGRPPAYFVPTEYLHSIDDLRISIQKAV